MVKELQKNKLYQWTAPQYASGLVFRVIRITPRSFIIRYVNSPYRDFVDTLELSNSFVTFNLYNLKQIG